MRIRVYRILVKLTRQAMHPAIEITIWESGFDRSGRSVPGRLERDVQIEILSSGLWAGIEPVHKLFSRLQIECLIDAWPIKTSYCGLKIDAWPIRISYCGLKIDAWSIKISRDTFWSIKSHLRSPICAPALGDNETSGTWCAVTCRENGTKSLTSCTRGEYARSSGEHVSKRSALRGSA